MAGGFPKIGEFFYISYTSLWQLFTGPYFKIDIPSISNTSNTSSITGGVEGKILERYVYLQV